MNLNGLTIENKAVLAPMAGFCDIVMRKVADDFGAGFTVSEMVSARALRYGDKKSRQLMESWAHRGRYGIQLFGFDPVDFGPAVAAALEYNPDFIDINMGCPAPKITSNGAGSALMKDVKLAASIAQATVKAAGSLPVSVKMRKGWDDNCITCVQLAKRCEEVGVKFITVHGRTRQQMYTPGIDLSAIEKVKQAVSIPVIGNGDIVCAEDAVKMMETTGCDRVMVGRHALSHPWIFRQIDRALSGKETPADLDINVRMELLTWHIKQLCRVNGEYLGMRKARGQAALYMKGLKGAARLRYMTNSLSVYADREKLVEEVLKENSDV